MKIKRWSGDLIVDKPANTIRLQGIGWVFGKPAAELEVGDTMVWNCGYTSKVHAITNETAKTLTISEEYTNSSGETVRGERKLHKSRIVAMAH